MNKRNRTKNNKSNSIVEDDNDIVIEDIEKNEEKTRKKKDKKDKNNKKQKIDIVEEEDEQYEEDEKEDCNDDNDIEDDKEDKKTDDIEEEDEEQNLVNSSSDMGIVENNNINERINREVNNIVIGNGTSQTGQIIDRSLALNRLIGLINNNISTYPNILNYINESNDTLISTFNNSYINNVNNVSDNNYLNNQYIPMVNPMGNFMEQIINILGEGSNNITNNITENNHINNRENTNINNISSDSDSDSDSEETDLNNDNEDDYDEDDYDEENNNSDNYDNESGDEDEDYEENREEQNSEEYANNMLTEGFDYQINDADYERLSEVLNDFFIDSMQYDDDSDETRINNSIRRFLSTPRHNPKMLVKVILLYTDSGKNVLFQNNYMTVIDSIKDGLRRNLENERRVRQFANLFFRGIGINLDDLEDVKVVLKESEFDKMKEIKYKDAKTLTDDEGKNILCEDSTCVICQEETEDNDYIRIMPPCKHFYHKDCVDKWLREESNKCPLCKCEVGEGERID
jgi:hypothetical protein